MKFSPHAWGWSDIARHFGKHVCTIRSWLDLHSVARTRIIRRSVFITAAALRRLERALAKKEEV